MLHIMDVITDKPGWEEKVCFASFVALGLSLMIYCIGF